MLEDLGRHPESLDWQEQAKTRKAAEIGYDVEQGVALIATAVAFYGASERNGYTGLEGANLVVLLSLTLLLIFGLVIRILVKKTTQRLSMDKLEPVPDSEH